MERIAIKRFLSCSLDSFTTFCGLLMLAAAALGCGDAEKLKEQQANDFYAEKLQTKAQAECNERGYVFDPMEAACLEKKDIKLAKFACTHAGVVAELGRNPQVNRKDQLVQLEKVLGEGFVLHQCGVAPSGELYLVAIKKGVTGDRATLEMQRLIIY
jgi:hypothetical protein